MLQISIQLTCRLANQPKAHLELDLTQPTCEPVILEEPSTKISPQAVLNEQPSMPSMLMMRYEPEPRML
jgi:hypothetical protein